MLNEKNLILFLVLICFSRPSVANTEGKILWIESEVSNNEQALQITMESGLNTCTHANAQWTESAYLDSSSPNFKSILSLALAAYMANKTVLLGAYYSAEKGSRCIITKIRIK